MRCRKITEEQLTKAIEKCKSLEDATYDAEFSLGIKELYCSELIYVSYENNLIEANLEDFVGLGRDYIELYWDYTMQKIWKLLLIVIYCKGKL